MIKKNYFLPLHNLYELGGKSNYPHIRKFFNIVAIFLVILLLCILARNLNSPNFWFDESGQFWLALGQNHYSAANTATQSIKEVWTNSKSFNLDPGGFTLLLRGLIYSFENTSPLILRSLPFFFSIVLCFGLLYWGVLLKVSLIYTSLVIFLLFLNSNFLYYSLELRAYSMELCGAVLLFLATERISKKNNTSNQILWLACLVLFGSSRYSYVIYETAAFASIITVSYLLKKSIDKQIVLILGFSLLIFNLFLYFGMLQYQSVSASPPPYVQDLLIYGKDLNQILVIFKNNFLDPFAIPKTIFLFLYLAYLFRKGSFESINPKITLLFFYILFATLIAIFLSIIGKLPWSVNSKWSLSELSLSALALIGCFAILKDLAFIIFIRSRFLFLSHAILPAAILFLQIYLILGILKYDRTDKEYEPIYSSLEFIYKRSSAGEMIVLDRWMWPSYRYIIEKSGLKFSPHSAINLQVMDIEKFPEIRKLAEDSKFPIYIIYGAPWDESKKNDFVNSLKGDLNPKVYDMDKYKHLRVIVTREAKNL